MSLGSLFKAPKSTTTTVSEPWGPQGDALKYGFDQLQGVVGSKIGTPYYQGDTYANLDPLTSQGIEGGAGYATGAGAQAASGVGGAAGGLLPAGAGALGLYGQLGSLAGQDPTQANIGAAGAYANNPFLSGQIDAASRDVSRNLYENQLPGLNQAATGSGNINSSRAGVAEGIMKRGAADQIGDIASTMRGNAYSQGLSLAEQARQGNMQGLASAGSGFGDVFDMGLKGSALGQDMNYRNYDDLIRGGQLNQADEQGDLTSAFQRWQGGDTRDMGLLTQYLSSVGGIPGFGTQTTTGPAASGSPFQQAVGGATAALGAYKMFSDPALKTNIVPTGERTKDGIEIVQFDYLDVPKMDLPRGRQTGVLATDVAKVRPDALGFQDGYLTVDYGKL